MKVFKAVIFLIISLAIAAAVHAEEKDIFKLAETEYFSVNGYNGLDTYLLIEKLNIDYFLQPNAIFAGPALDKESILSKAIDAIYLEVSDILDIHIYSFHGGIELVQDKEALESEFKKYFDTDFKERSFYLSNNNTIYISFQDLTLGMLGHEIAHAIISRYFVVPPPSTVQEVLCGYVEYKLRKSTNTLN